MVLGQQLLAALGPQALRIFLDPNSSLPNPSLPAMVQQQTMTPNLPAMVQQTVDDWQLTQGPGPSDVAMPGTDDDLQMWQLGADLDQSSSSGYPSWPPGTAGS